MHVTHIGRVAGLVLVLCATVTIAAQDGDLKKRLTAGEVEAVRADVAGAGTSGLPAVTTRVLFGDPRGAGLYTIELRIAPNTTIQAHTHRDTRTAVVIDGLWYFGYGSKNEPALEKELDRGSFYTEPGGQLHFARTGPQGATIAITGIGPTDTVYAK
jgi:quercetin dioxygenase-like cupin family protein